MIYQANTVTPEVILSHFGGNEVLRIEFKSTRILRIFKKDLETPTVSVHGCKKEMFESITKLLTGEITNKGREKTTFEGFKELEAA